MIKVETKTIAKITAAVFILYLVIRYWPNLASIMGSALQAAMPLLVGCFIAYYLNILMSFYERHFFPKSKKEKLIRSRRPICIILAIFTLIAILTLILALIIPQLISCFELLFDLLIKVVPVFVDDLFAEIEKFEILPEDIISKLDGINWQSELTKIFTSVFSSLGNVFNVIISAVNSFISIISTLLVAVIFAIYLLSGKNTISLQCKRLTSHFISEKKFDTILHILSVFNDSFRRFIVGQCTEAVILGSLCLVGMLILKLPYAPMISVVIAVTCFIPVVGEFLGGAVGVFLIMVQSPLQALIFLIFLVVLLNLEGNLIFPRVIGSSIGLPAIWLLAAVTIGAGVFGILGVIISVPIAAAVYRLLGEYIKPYKEKKLSQDQEKAAETEISAEGNS